MEKYISLHSSSDSEDEIFINKVHRREIERHLHLGRRTLSVISVSDESEDEIASLIEMQSEPELMQVSLSPETPARIQRTPCRRRSLSQPDLRDSVTPLTWEAKVTDDSFLAIENLISNTSPHNGEFEKIYELLRTEREPNVTQRKHDEIGTNPSTSQKIAHVVSTFKKPLMGKSTMTGALRAFDNRFKSPSTPIVQKGLQSAKKIKPMQSLQVKTPHFNNIESPVGYYIRNSPQAPLMQTVRPRRPLPGMSAIPKRVDLPVRANKENICQNLPAKAYVGAKQTKLIVTPNQMHLPPNKQVREMASAIPHAAVIRHVSREKHAGSCPTLPTPDESFAKLNISQADVSVCFIKSAEVKHTLKRK